MESIRVLIVDDVRETCENIKCLLHFDDRIEVVGEAQNGEEAVRKAEELQPDVILMDINMPVMDGIAATEAISCRVPRSSIVIMSVQGEQEYLRRAMAAGAREYIVKPFTNEELVTTVYRVFELNRKRLQQLPGERVPSPARSSQVVTVFSTKGGVGKTTLAVNLGVCLARDFGYSVALLDLDLQFGDVAVMLNLVPRQTLSDLVAEFSNLDGELLESFLEEHSSGLRVLPAPLRPEFAELVSSALVERVIEILKKRYDFVMIDTPGLFTDPGMVALDCAQEILFVVSLDVPTLKNVKLGLEVLESLHHKEKVKLVLNRAVPEMGLGPKDAEKTLGMPLFGQVPSDGRLVVDSVNRGIPFVVSRPDSRIAESVRRLAHLLARQKEGSNGYKKKRGLLRILRAGKGA